TAHRSGRCYGTAASCRRIRRSRPRPGRSRRSLPTRGRTSLHLVSATSKGGPMLSDVNEATARSEGAVERTRRGTAKVIDVLGIHCEWRIREADTGGHYCVLEMHVPPGAGVPPHQHAQQETFFIAEGAAEFARVGPDGVHWFIVGPSDSENVPACAFHSLQNPTELPAIILLLYTPEIVQLLYRAGLPVNTGTPLPTGPPDPTEI